MHVVIHYQLTGHALAAFKSNNIIRLVSTLASTRNGRKTAIQQHFIQDNLSKPVPELTETLIDTCIPTSLSSNSTPALPFQASQFTSRVQC